MIAESDRTKDENVGLKMRVAELEAEMMEERQVKEMRLETTIREYKSNVQGQYIEQKVRFDELVMVEKEKNNRLRLENQRLQEDLQQLKRQLLNIMIKSEDLEKENYNL